MSTESVMLSNHLILCHPLVLPSIFPSLAAHRFHQSALHRARGILQGKKKGGTFEPHGESSTGTPRPAEEGKSPPMNHGPSWEGGNEIEREGMGL